MTVTIKADYPPTTVHRPSNIEIFIDDDTINRVTAADLTGASDLICDVAATLGAPTRTVDATDPVIALHVSDGGRMVTVRINDEDIATVDHDQAGYAGLDAVLATARRIAQACGHTAVTIEQD